MRKGNMVSHEGGEVLNLGKLGNATLIYLQEVVDMQCEVERRGRIFFPDFCNLCLRFQLGGIDWSSDMVLAEGRGH